MKKAKRYLLTSISILLLICTVFALSGCMNSEQAAELKETTEELIDEIIEGDEDDAYEIAKHACTEEEFKEFFKIVHPVLKNIESYELKQVGWNSSFNNGISYYAAAFDMTADDGTVYTVNITQEAESGNIVGFNIDLKENSNTDSAPNYSLLTLPFNIGLTVFSLLVIAFCIWMIVDCAKRKIRLKALWIIIILLGVSLTFIVGKSGINFNFMIGLFITFSSMSYIDSDIMLRLTIPVGAIVYLILRKKLPLKELPAPSAEQAPSEDNQTENDKEESSSEDTPAEDNTSD